MPAAETSLDVVMSHPGATYGGLIPAYPIGQSEVVEIFNLLVTKLQESSINKSGKMTFMHFIKLASTA
jgi:hypothetical protein